jgi:hypothetical protein
MIGAALWTLLWFVLMALAIALGLLGDCPEYIFPNWHDTACSDHKDVARYVIFIGGPLIWLALTIFIFRRRSR